MADEKKETSMAHEGRMLVAIMFTDIVGYTVLSQVNEAQALEILKQHNQLLRPFFARYEGREIKTIGDSFLVEFKNALDATNCAVAIQSYLHDYNVSAREDWKIKIRIGIHLGDVVHENNDIFGDAVNIASRIQPLADPEGVCVSEQVFDQVHNKLDSHIEQLEQTKLKNVKFETKIFSIRMPWEEGSAGTPRMWRPKEVERLDKYRIAVLPFTNMSSDSGDEYFSDGLTEELISTMSKISQLSVIARTSVMGYKNKDKTVTEIAKELNVGTLLEGSVRKAGNRVRITAQLIDAVLDKHLWAENYDRNLEDIFAVQSDVAEKIAASLEVKLVGEEKKRIDKKSTSSVEAHLEYLKGQYSLQRWDKDSLFRAIKHFENALSHDQKYALALCGLASAYSIIGFQNMSNPREAYQKARSYANSALELDVALPQAHVSLALALLNEYDFTGRERELKKAIELDNSFATPHAILAVDYSYRGRQNESLQEVEKALELDPISVNSFLNAGTMYLYGGLYNEAIDYLKSALEIDPTNYLCLQNLGLAHVQTGKISEGLTEVKTAVEKMGTTLGYSDLAFAYVKANDISEAKKLLTILQKEGTSGKIVSPALAGVYASLGEKQKALDYLERSYEERAGYLPAVKTDFVFENLREEPRFRALVQKMGLA